MGAEPALVSAAQAGGGASAVADRVCRSLPCSIELPAGAGKTELVAELADLHQSRDQRTLILTHTNAGVDALRRRLRERRCSAKSATVRTIDGWCFDLVRHFPELSRLEVPADPDWDQSQSYHQAAEEAVRAPAVRRMLAASYELIAVDEYQDCVLAQHRAIAALREVVPTVVFGDPLQGLFDFGGNDPVDWVKDVLPLFPECEVPVRAWRWEDGNAELGRWLLEIRPALKRGETVNLTEAPVEWRCISEPRQRVRVQSSVCFGQPHGGSVVALGRMAHDCLAVAAKLNGSYAMMEELEGKRMLSFAEVLDGDDSAKIAEATADFARGCALGVAEVVDKRKRRRLGEGEPISTTKPEFLAAHRALSGLLEESSPRAVRSALEELARLPGFRPYCREAWGCVIDALGHAAVEEALEVRTAVIRIRNHSRVVGRPSAARVVSRPLLVKGLQYDRAVLLNADLYGPAELYVAMSRGIKSVTVMSASRTLSPARS